MADPDDIARLANLLHVSAVTAEFISDRQASPHARRRLQAIARMIEESAKEIDEVISLVIAERGRLC